MLSELNERAVDVLDLREPEGLRAQRIVYRYAIYTPQEEMKNVLIGKVEPRLQTLREAFGIEDYKIASGNAMIIIKYREKIGRIEGEIEGLDEKKRVLEDRQKAIERDEKSYNC